MSAEFQMIFSIMILGISALGGHLLRNLSADIRELKASDDAMAKQLRSVEMQVAGDFVTRVEFAHTMDRIYDKLDALHSEITRVTK